MAAKKYYVVKKGITPDIYLTWDDCKKMVDGYPGAVYKGFATLAEAEAFLNGSAGVAVPVSNAETKKAGMKSVSMVEEKLPAVYAFVDGSFNPVTNVYGYGGFLFYNGEKVILQGAGDDEEMASMRNVAGEILGSMAAIEKALELGLPEVTVYYDYAGIEMWATGAWKRNKTGTIQYHEYIRSVEDKIRINFVKVKGHSGVEGNEEADMLAKQAVGINE